MPFFWISSCLITGIILALQGFSSPGWKWVSLWVVLATGILILLRLRKKTFPGSGFFYRFLPNTRLPLFLLPVFVVAGMWVYQFHLPGETNTIYSQNQPKGYITLSGKVVEPPDEREKTTLVKVQASQFQFDGSDSYPTHETVLVFLPASYDIQYGDQVTLRGDPVTPADFDDFSYRDYLAGQKIFSILYYPVVQDIQPQNRFDLYQLFVSI